MKTQIKNLINGQKKVRRDLSNEKYTAGFAGTKNNERNSIAQKIIEENPAGIRIECFGRDFFLKRSQSLSGKTVWFSCEISLEDFMLLSGYKLEPFEYESSFELSINPDMTVYLNKFTRKTPSNTWAERGHDAIDEAFITIL